MTHTAVAADGTLLRELFLQRLPAEQGPVPEEGQVEVAEQGPMAEGPDCQVEVAEQGPVPEEGPDLTARLGWQSRDPWRRDLTARLR